MTKIPQTLEQIERAALAEAIKAEGSIVGAARRLGIGRATAFRKVKRYGLREPAAVVEKEPPPPAPVVEAPKPMADPLFGSWKP